MGNEKKCKYQWRNILWCNTQCACTQMAYGVEDWYVDHLGRERVIHSLLNTVGRKKDETHHWAIEDRYIEMGAAHPPIFVCSFFNFFVFVFFVFSKTDLNLVEWFIISGKVYVYSPRKQLPIRSPYILMLRRIFSVHFSQLGRGQWITKWSGAK